MLKVVDAFAGDLFTAYAFAYLLEGYAVLQARESPFDRSLEALRTHPVLEVFLVRGVDIRI